MRLTGKVALITAGARGAGKDIAVVFAGEGAKVAIGDPDARVAEQCAREIDPTGRHVIGVGMDLADPTQVEAATGRVVETFGALDVLVDLVGSPPVRRLCDDELFEWKRRLATRLDSAFVVTRAALRRMHQQGQGRIIYVGSMRSNSDPDLVASYARLRRGLFALANAVSREGVALDVRATTIWPGATPRAVADAAVVLALPVATQSNARKRGRHQDDRIGSISVADADAGCVLELATAFLPLGLCTLERIARHLGVDPRTLQRRLARQDTSFGTIVDDLRADQAVSYLRDTHLNLTEVAEALGFSALSAFSRWFRQRFRCSATAWRTAEVGPAL